MCYDKVINKYFSEHNCSFQFYPVDPDEKIEAIMISFHCQVDI